MALADLIGELLMHLVNRRTPGASKIKSENVPGVVLGYDTQSREPLVLPEGERSRHVLLVGSSGSGKTNPLMQMVKHDILLGRAFWVIDLRGDLITRILRLLFNLRDLLKHIPCLIDL